MLILTGQVPRLKYLIAMADLADPDSAVDRKPRPAPPLGRLTFGIGIEELGLSSFRPFLVIAALIALSPLGQIAAVSIATGLGVMVLGVQLILRRPSIALPAFFRKFILGNDLAQWMLKRALRRRDSAGHGPRRAAHWMTKEPFDMFPRTMILICGVMMCISWSVPLMSQMLGAALLLLAFGLQSRRAYATVAGIGLTSLASVTPLFAG